MIDGTCGEKKYPAFIPIKLKNASAQIMAAAAQLPERHSAPLNAAAKTVFDLASKLEKNI